MAQLGAIAFNIPACISEYTYPIEMVVAKKNDAKIWQEPAYAFKTAYRQRILTLTVTQIQQKLG